MNQPGPTGMSSTEACMTLCQMKSPCTESEHKQHLGFVSEQDFGLALLTGTMETHMRMYF